MQQVFGSQALAVELYLAFNGTAPSNPIYTNYVSTINSSSSINLALQLGQATASISDATLASSVLANLGISAATTNQAAFDALSAALLQVFAAYPGAQRGVVIHNMVNLLVGLEGNATYGNAATAFNNTVTNAYTYASNTANTTPGTPSAGTTFALTTGADTFTGGAGNDTFNAAQTTAATWTVGDKLDGGAGTDTFNVTQTAAIALPTGATVSNIELLNFVSGGTVTLDATAFTGATTLSASGVGGEVLTAAATTDVTVVDSAMSTTADAGIFLNGGKNVTATLTAANATTDGDNAAEVSVGSVTAAAGAVSITLTGAYADGADNTMSNIAVNGGTTVSVTTKTGLTAAQLAAQTTDTTNNTITQSAVAVTGNASTTAVTVTQDAAVVEADSATAGKIGVKNGAVTIADANASSATAAGTITTVTLNNYGDSTINSGALNTVNLSGTGGTLGITTGSLTTAAVDTLALNVNGLSYKNATTGNNAITVDSDIKTLNIGSSTASSTVANLTANGVTVLNVSGDKALTLTDNTFGALTTVNVTNTGGLTLGTTAIAAGVTFNGGAGADAVILSNAFTKTITMGDGNDKVTYGGAAGTGGSVSAGNGTDTIVMTSAQAATADNDATFNSKFTGFEVLELSDALGAATTLDMAGINGVSQVVLDAGGANTTTSIISNISSGATVTLKANSTGVVIQEANAAFNSSDVLNLNLSKTTSLTGGSVTAAGVETININDADASTSSAGSAAAVHTLTLVAVDATTVTVTGNNGLNLTNTGNTKITTFDASGVAANGTVGLDTAANLAVTFVSANTTGSATVTIKGGAGDDTLTGNASKDTIVGGAGADTITGGTGVDTLTGGTGADIFAFAAGDAGVTGSEKITDYTAAATGGDKLDLAGTALLGDQTATSVSSVISGAVDLTATVKNGVITLGGADVGLVDTVAELKAVFEAIDADNTLEVGAIQMGGNTYVLVDAASGGGADSVTDIIQLVGVTGITAVSTTAAANTIWIA